jgi:hypothetical protein
VVNIQKHILARGTVGHARATSLTSDATTEDEAPNFTKRHGQFDSDLATGANDKCFSLHGIVSAVSFTTNEGEMIFFLDKNQRYLFSSFRRSSLGRLSGFRTRFFGCLEFFVQQTHHLIGGAKSGTKSSYSLS